ncbi:hypothetical protein EYW49_16620 [Siculibacillus lacustris]|uniref:Uncharacterized protein n=1 Tax=Siculibacillus lacustris TaxID=1549641 RepID=A0A4Q9VIJ5_9HYPH|nr:hypothetical protein [Siculibacillus lacustris]TBW35073.1 hypothetical protein EYW49_16620 [Siculibacillus lacustris]
MTRNDLHTLAATLDATSPKGGSAILSRLLRGDAPFANLQADVAELVADFGGKLSPTARTIAAMVMGAETGAVLIKAAVPATAAVTDDQKARFLIDMGFKAAPKVAALQHSPEAARAAERDEWLASVGMGLSEAKVSTRVPVLSLHSDELPEVPRRGDWYIRDRTGDAFEVAEVEHDGHTGIRCRLIQLGRQHGEPPTA